MTLDLKTEQGIGTLFFFFLIVEVKENAYCIMVCLAPTGTMLC